MSKNRRQDFISSVFFMILAIVIYYMSLQVKVDEISKIGTNFVPILISLGMFILSLSILVDTIRAKNTTEAKEKKNNLPVYLTFLSLISYVLLIEKIGFLIMTILYLFTQMFILSGFKKKNAILYLIISIAVASFTYFGFRNFLDVLLPTGILN